MGVLGLQLAEGKNIRSDTAESRWRGDSAEKAVAPKSPAGAETLRKKIQPGTTESCWRGDFAEKEILPDIL